MMSMASRIRLVDIAHHCGVSVAAVSMALTKSEATCDLAAGTRERIRRAAHDLGYRPSWAGRALQARRSGVVGLFSGDIGGALNTFNSAIIEGISRHLLTSGRFLALVPVVAGDGSWRALVDEGRLDGALILSGVEASCARVLDAAGLPVVRVNVPTASGRMPGRGRHLLIDDAALVATALDHLVGLGHCRLLHYRRPPKPGAHASEVLRETAFLKGCRDRGGEGQVVAAAADLAAALRGSGRPTAILAYNDLYARDAIQVCQALGLDVPGAVSVMGIDDVADARRLHPALTTIRIPAADLGRRAIALLDGDADGIDRVSGDLIVRASTAARP